MNKPTPNTQPEPTGKESLQVDEQPEEISTNTGMCESCSEALMYFACPENPLNESSDKKEIHRLRAILKAAEIDSDKQQKKIEKQHCTIRKNVKLIKKIGDEKRRLMDLFLKHIEDDRVISLAEDICSRSKINE